MGEDRGRVTISRSVIEEWDRNLKAGAAFLLLRLAARANWAPRAMADGSIIGRGQAIVSAYSLGKQSGGSRRALARQMKSLEDAGYIETQPIGRKTLVTITDFDRILGFGDRPSEARDKKGQITKHEADNDMPRNDSGQKGAGERDEKGQITGQTRVNDRDKKGQITGQKGADNDLPQNDSGQKGAGERDEKGQITGQKGADNGTKRGDYKRRGKKGKEGEKEEGECRVRVHAHEPPPSPSGREWLNLCTPIPFEATGDRSRAAQALADKHRELWRQAGNSRPLQLHPQGRAFAAIQAALVTHSPAELSSALDVLAAKAKAKSLPWMLGRKVWYNGSQDPLFLEGLETTVAEIRAAGSPRRTQPGGSRSAQVGFELAARLRAEAEAEKDYVDVESEDR